MQNARLLWFDGMKQFAPCCMIVLLTACAPAAPPHVTVHSDEFSREIEVEGVAQFENPVGEYNPHLWRLRSFINKDTHEVIHQAYLFVLYKTARKNFKYADDDTATPLKIKPITSGECEGNTAEKCEAFGIPVSDAALRAHEAGGYRIRVKARNGETEILDFTPQMIRLQREAVGKLAGPANE